MHYVRLFFCGVTDAAGPATAADLRCGDLVIASAPLLVPFCDSAATAVVSSAKPTLVPTAETIAVVSIAVCLGLVVESIVFV